MSEQTDNSAKKEFWYPKKNFSDKIKSLKAAQEKLSEWHKFYSAVCDKIEDNDFSQIEFEDFLNKLETYIMQFAAVELNAISTQENLAPRHQETLKNMIQEGMKNKPPRTKLTIENLGLKFADYHSKFGYLYDQASETIDLTLAVFQNLEKREKKLAALFDKIKSGLERISLAEEERNQRPRRQPSGYQSNLKA